MRIDMVALEIWVFLVFGEAVAKFVKCKQSVAGFSQFATASPKTRKTLIAAPPSTKGKRSPDGWRACLCMIEEYKSNTHGLRNEPGLPRQNPHGQKGGIL